MFRKNYRSDPEVAADSSAASPVPLSQGSQNEYKFIEETVSGIVLEKQRLEEKQLRQKRVRYGDHFLVRLIKGKQGRPPFRMPRSYTETYQIRACNPINSRCLSFTWTILVISPSSRTPTRRGRKNWSISSSKISWKTYVRQQNHNGFIIEVDQFLVCLVNFKVKDETKQKNEVLEIAEQAIQLFETDSGSFVRSASAESIPGSEDIKSAYEEAIEAIEYKLVVGEKSIIHYTEIFERTERIRRFTASSAAQENQFANRIRAGDYGSAKRLISEMIGRYSKLYPLRSSRSTCPP